MKASAPQRSVRAQFECVSSPVFKHTHLIALEYRTTRKAGMQIDDIIN
jgi:hypothetical protein